jgi:hypothetical protein
MSRKDYILARKADCFAQRKNATDPRFLSRVHQDIYESIILKHAILPQKSVNMEFIDSNSASFPGCVEIIDAMGLRGILTLSRDWSEEAVMQFYATCRFVPDDDRSLVWSTEGTQLSVTFEEFARLLNIHTGENLYKIHARSDTCDSMTGVALAPLRRANADVTVDNAQSTSLLVAPYPFMHKVINMALVPKIGDREKVRNFAIDLLVRMHTHGTERFDLADFLYEQIRLASYLQDRTFPYAPYIQVLIDAKFQQKIFKDCKHKMWTPQTDGTGETAAAARPSKKKQAGPSRDRCTMPSKFEKFMAKTQKLLFGICKSNADEIAKLKSVDRVKINKYKAQVRELGGHASDDEVVASSSTASPRYTFPTKRYAEYFDNDSSDGDGDEPDGNEGEARHS